MATIRSNYVNNNIISITLAGLADEGMAESVAIDNSIDRFVSADIQLKYKTGISVSPIGIVELFLGRSVDGGTTFDDSAVNAESVGSFNADIDSTAFVASTDTAFNGQLPDFWKLYVRNLSGAALDSTAANFYAKFLGKRFESV